MWFVNTHTHMIAHVFSEEPTVNAENDAAKEPSGSAPVAWHCRALGGPWEGVPLSHGPWKTYHTHKGPPLASVFAPGGEHIAFKPTLSAKHEKMGPVGPGCEVLALCPLDHCAQMKATNMWVWEVTGPTCSLDLLGMQRCLTNHLCAMISASFCCSDVLKDKH